MSTIEKVNLSSELVKEVTLMREKITSKVSNLEEAIAFSKLFRLDLYNLIKDLENAG